MMSAARCVVPVPLRTATVTDEGATTVAPWWRDRLLDPVARAREVAVDAGLGELPRLLMTSTAAMIAATATTDAITSATRLKRRPLGGTGSRNVGGAAGRPAAGDPSRRRGIRGGGTSAGGAGTGAGATGARPAPLAPPAAVDGGGPAGSPSTAGT